MQITSSVLAHNHPVPKKYTCKGENISPPFEFHDVPDNAKSFALIVDDLDSTNNWIHWLVYNIPGDVRKLEEGRLPSGAIDGVCNGGTHGYEGPCPVYFAGIHHYRFKVYALDISLDLPYEADTRKVLAEMEGHILDEATLVAVSEGELVEERR